MAESQGFFERLRSLISSFPRTRALLSLGGSRASSDFGEALSSRHSREGGNPETSNVLARKALDARLPPSESRARVRGNDEQGREEQQQQKQQKQQAAPVYIAAKRGVPKRRNGAGDGR